jgi:cathepsin B
MKLLVLFALVAVAFANLDLQAPALDGNLIAIVNSDPSSTWRAGVNTKFLGANIGDAKRLCGVLPGNTRFLLKEQTQPISDEEAKAIPTAFDARQQWGKICPSTAEVRDQAACGSCWAFGAVEAMTDRFCIASNGSIAPHLSAEDMLSCCDSCGMGCEGGYPSAAWDYWVQTGLVSGGNYGDSSACYAYAIPGCDHHVKGKLPPCGDIVDTPDCQNACDDPSKFDWGKDKRFGAKAYGVSSRVQDIQNEIMKFGPVEAAFTVYQDFLTYASGVYQHKTGQMLGGHAVKVLGWGVQGSTPYWWVANSWNEDWGDKGYFRILRGSDECGIESEIVAGTPKLK